jgi:hypothetical protein
MVSAADLVKLGTVGRAEGVSFVMDVPDKDSDAVTRSTLCELWVWMK